VIADHNARGGPQLAIALEWTDVDPRRRTMHVQRSSWNGQVTLPKGGQTRRLPLTERLAHALHAHRHLKGPRVPYYDDGAPPTQGDPDLSERTFGDIMGARDGP
jgi:integrase